MSKSRDTKSLITKSLKLDPPPAPVIKRSCIDYLLCRCRRSKKQEVVIDYDDMLETEE